MIANQVTQIANQIRQTGAAAFPNRETLREGLLSKLHPFYMGGAIARAREPEPR